LKSTLKAELEFDKGRNAINVTWWILLVTFINVFACQCCSVFKSVHH